MFKTNVNQKSVSHIRDGIEALKLPDYVGTAVLNRVTDKNGQVVLTDGKLTTTEPYIFVKSASLALAQQQSVVDVVTDAPSQKTVKDAEEKAWADGATTRNALAEIQRLESSVTPRRIREMTTDSGKQWVNNVEELIAIERGKL